MRRIVHPLRLKKLKLLQIKSIQETWLTTIHYYHELLVHIYYDTYFYFYPTDIEWNRL